MLEKKIALNSGAINEPNLINQLSKIYGNQAIIGAIDVKKNLFGNEQVWSYGGLINTKKDPVKWALGELEDREVREIFFY